LITDKGNELSSLYFGLTMPGMEKTTSDHKIHFFNEQHRILTVTSNRNGLFDDKRKCWLQKITNKFAQQKNQMQLIKKQGLELK